MTKICPCGKPATHRVLWNQWLETVEPIPSKRPSRCLERSKVEAARATVEKREQLDYQQNFDPLTRRIFSTTGPVPAEWIKLARQTSKRHPEVINPKGLVNVWARDNHLYVELYPPQGIPENMTWQPENALYILRYLVRRPLSFREVPTAASPSPVTWRESRRQWTGTGLPPVVCPKPEPQA
jgi:hypothetical protein